MDAERLARSMPRPVLGIALRVEVDEEHRMAGGGECRAEIDRRRGLADAALLVGDGQNAGAGLGLLGSRWTGSNVRMEHLARLDR